MKKKRQSIKPEDSHPLGQGAGRKEKGVVRASTQQVFDYSAPVAAKILRDVASGTRKSISNARQRACEFIINHAIGTPRQKVEMKHTGSPVTYKELAEEADRVIKAAKEAGKTVDDVLKQAEEVAAQAEEELDQGAGTDTRPEPSPGDSPEPNITDT